MATGKVTPSASIVTEGKVISSSVVTTGLANGAPVYWVLSGVNNNPKITSADFSTPIRGSGKVVVPKGSTTGSLKLTHGIAADGLVEGNEVAEIKVYEDAARTRLLGSAQFTIQDLVKAGQTNPTGPVVVTPAPAPAPAPALAPATQTFKPQFTPFTVEKWKSPLPVPPIKQPFSVGGTPGAQFTSPTEWNQPPSQHLAAGVAPTVIDPGNTGNNAGLPRPAGSVDKAGPTISWLNLSQVPDPNQTKYGGQAPELWNPTIPANLNAAPTDPSSKVRPYYQAPNQPIQWYEQVETAAKQAVVDTPGTNQVLTQIYGYDGMFPGPTFKTKVAAPVVVRHWNQLPDPTVNGQPSGLPAGMFNREGVHLHGNHGNSFSDGYPSFVLNPGMHRDYYYANTVPYVNKNGVEVPDFGESPSTMWYHDHGEDITDRNVIMGLAGFWLSYDDHEISLIKNGYLPGADAGASATGFDENKFLQNNSKYDVPLALTDRRFNADGSFYYDGWPVGNNTDGYLGDVMLVNGKSYPYMNVDRTQYRFRMLGASTARIWRLRFEDAAGNPISHVRIGNDTWLDEKPLSMTEFTLSMAQRADLVMDFSKVNPNIKEIYLVNKADQTSGRGPGGTLDTLGQGTFKEQIMKFVINNNTVQSSAPKFNELLSPTPTTPILRENTPILQSEIAKTRTFQFGRSGGQWVINQQLFDSHRSDNPQQLGTAEEWILQNGSGGWWHPIHAHLESHQLKDINGVAPSATYWPEKQWKSDTTLLGPNTTARIWMKFRTFEGPFVFHCHNLNHEDSMMMYNFDPEATLSPTYTAGSPIPADKNATPALYPHFHHLVPATGAPAVALKGGAASDHAAAALGKKKRKSHASHQHIHPKGNRLEGADGAPTEISQVQLQAFSKSSWGGKGADQMQAQQADEYLNARSGDDLLIGFTGHDMLVGGDGDDTIKGGSGHDLIAGEIGNDRLTGGEGQDLFRFISMDPGHTDVITDFKGGEDQICFNLALVNTNGKQAEGWTYIKDNAFGGHAGEVRFDRGLLQADLNGDGQSDVAAQLLGVKTFSADWIAPFNAGTGS